MSRIIKRTAGGIKEHGMLDSWLAQGFDDSKCFSELMSNSIDAGCTEINIYITEDGAKLVLADNGNGMDETMLCDMLDAYAKKKILNKSMGNYGLGAKPSLMNLSRCGKVAIITKYGDHYNVAHIDWAKIIKDEKYTDNINIYEANADEILRYKEYNNDSSGTVITMDSDSKILDILNAQFNIVEDLIIKPNDKWSVIFGRFNCKIQFKNHLLALYNPTADLSNIDGTINCHEIDVMRKSNGSFRFITDYTDPKTGTTSTYELGKTGRSWNEKVTVSNENKMGLGTSVGKLHLDVYKLKGIKIKGGGKWIGDYDEMLQLNSGMDDIQDFKKKVHIIRNDQYIGCADIVQGKARGGLNSNLKASISTELSYYPIPNQADAIDKTIGVQVNKNQLNCKLDRGLHGLVTWARDKKYNELSVNAGTEKNRAVVTSPAVAKPAAAKPAAAKPAAASPAAAKPIATKKTKAAAKPSAAEPVAENRKRIKGTIKFDENIKLLYTDLEDEFKKIMKSSKNATETSEDSIIKLYNQMVNINKA
jgi:hypothetical protein